MTLRLNILIFITVFLSATPTLGFAESSGITGYSGSDPLLTCTRAGCHTDSSTTIDIFLYKLATRYQPIDAFTQLRYQFVLEIVGPGAAGGFNMSVSDGVLSSARSDVFRNNRNGELSHLSPQLVKNNAARWEFDWQSPATTGTVTFYICANIVNLNRNNFGDNSGCRNFEITVDTLSTPDTSAPIIIPLEDLTYNSIGYFTPIELPQVEASDDTDVIVGALASDYGPFTIGTHRIEWLATDAHGNFSSVVQNVIIKPIITLQENRFISRGAALNISAYINGKLNSEDYPISFAIQLSGSASENIDYTVDSNFTEFISGNKASISLQINNTSAIENTVIDATIDLTSNANFLLGSNNRQAISITNNNLSPTVDIIITQGNNNGSVLFMDAGEVSISAIATDLESDTLSFDWSTDTANSITQLLSNTSTNRISFDPALLSSGLYTISVKVSDNGIPNAITQIDSWVRILPSMLPLSLNDFDQDGLTDATEGVLDADYDGIADYLDISSFEFVLAVDPQQNLHQLIQTIPGYVLRIGELARRENRNAAFVPQPSNENSMNPDIPMNISGVYDLEILLPSAHEPYASIALPALDILHDVDTLTVYNNDNGWRPFINDENNHIAFANSVDGICPTVGPAYSTIEKSPPLCLSIRLSDGGPNDSDSNQNGIIRLRIGSDRGANTSNKALLNITPDSGGGNPLILLVILLLYVHKKMLLLNVKRPLSFQVNPFMKNLILILALTIFLSACETIKPWERYYLARPDMALTVDSMDNAYRAHIYFSKEASSDVGSAGGGGCGCN